MRSVDYLACLMNTYLRVVQLGASRRRSEDSKLLLEHKHWNSAAYMGGYSIECSLKSLICYLEKTQDFKNTSFYKGGITGASLHILSRYLDKIESLRKAIELDKTNTYKPAWKLITSWSTDLRYSEKVGDEAEATRLLSAINIIYKWILKEQGEAP